MNFFVKTLCGTIPNKWCFNYAYFMMTNKKFCRVQYFSNVYNFSLFDPNFKSLKISNRNKADSFSNTRNFSLVFSDDLKRKFLNIINKLLLTERSSQVQLAAKWFETLENVNYKEFFSILEMPDTFYSWFLIRELHVWMLLVRLQQENSSFPKIRNDIINMMWDDVQLRASTHSHFNKNYKKNMTQFYQDFVMKLFTYDEAFLRDDKALAGSLWYYFFNKNCDDPRKLEILVSFIRYQIDQLQSVTSDNLKDENSTKLIWKSLSDHLNIIKL